MASYWRPNRLPEGTALGAMGPAMENCGRIDRRIAARARLPQPSQTHWRERVGAPLWERRPRRDTASKQAQWPFSSHRREGAAPTPASQAALLAVGGSRFHPLSLWERVWAKVDRDTAALS